MLTWQISDQLFSEVEHHSKAGREIPKHLLQTLNSIFQGPLMSALDMLDRRSVLKYKSPSSRHLLQIQGSQGTRYRILPATNYCTCLSYRYAVVERGEYPMCNHVLAGRLAEATGKLEEVIVSDSVLAEMIGEI